MAADPHQPDVAEFEAAGLYDPTAEDAAEHLELLRLLTGIGASIDDLAEYGPERAGMVTTLLLWPDHERLTMEQLAARAGVPDDVARGMWRAAGLADPGDEAVATSDDVDILRSVSLGTALLGEDAVNQLMRVVGNAAARVADAVISSFIVNVGSDALRADPAGLRLAQANVAAARLLPELTRAFDVVFRHQIDALSRPIDMTDVGLEAIETSPFAVGFVDLVDSTALSQQLGFAELGAALTTFEEELSDLITSGGGRMVKLIGDEVMYIAADAVQACRIALDAVDEFAAHPPLPPVRAGVAWGEVLLRQGDYFGPVVSLAARALKQAAPSTVVVTTEVRDEIGDAADLRFTAAGSATLKGFEQPVELVSVRRSRSD